ncbi:YeeE/YedE family protein [Aliivibrio fischeri]|uniref:YeeE/YedE family protein n=1 Tax=Aliivibrio fischeri TaxID=668 RepID=UPI000907DAC5|nr:YeeE/YedE family protein [Aliivibrio fischeri]MUJ25895.1 YeeE/YedE family protein [Aliivibrio fischeri]MUK27061.1 YeeE/YedE family protein [Aliivibrio fischeri]MUK34651.1 YeeE/YedE family protein [Aliivibrio fischeri]
MNNVMFRVIALISGGLFGIGMTLSGMADPEKVIGFLDVSGVWDPSLMFVMGGALLVFMPAYFLFIKPKTKPLNAEEFCLSTNKHIDSKLISGAAIFGFGWGLAGICPGPVVSSIALGNSDVFIFLFAMMFGLAMTNVLVKK